MYKETGWSPHTLAWEGDKEYSVNSQWNIMWSCDVIAHTYEQLLD